MGNSESNGYTGSTKAEEVLGKEQLDGKVVIVTGGNSGIGKETARVLLKAGATVIIAARSVGKLSEAKKDLLSQIGEGKGKLEAFELDLADSKSIYAFVDAFSKKYTQLDILINNAGVISTNGEKTQDGFEYVTEGLKRIITLSSNIHSIVKSIDLNGFNTTGTSYWAYAESKVCNIHFAKELNKRLQNDFGKEKFISVAVHPGMVNTDLLRDYPTGLNFLVHTIGAPFGKSIEQGASTTIFAILSNDLKGGEYLNDCHVDQSSDFSQDQDFAEKLWSFSESNTKILYHDMIKQEQYH